MSDCRSEFNRLAWRCRRGLLELDLWLGDFLDASRATLQPDELAAFERLLSLSDMQILDLLQCKSQSSDAGLCALVERIHITGNRDEQNSHPHF